MYVFSSPVLLMNRALELTKRRTVLHACVCLRKQMLLLSYDLEFLKRPVQATVFNSNCFLRTFFFLLNTKIALSAGNDLRS